MIAARMSRAKKTITRSGAKTAGVMTHLHAARTSGRRADRAEPSLRPTSGASSLQIRETFAGSMPASSP